MTSADAIKAFLLANPDKLKTVLDYFGFANIKEKREYISFGRNETSSPKSLVIYKRKNPNLLINDYARGTCGDWFWFLKTEKNVSRWEAIQEIRRILEYPSFTTTSYPVQEYIEDEKAEPDPIEESLLYKYKERINERFLKDGISLKTQVKYGLRYDDQSAAIIIPIRRADGKLVGIKARFNRDVEKGHLKYIYFEPCQISKTLFGFYQNFEVLLKSDIVFIFEAEKSVMQSDTFGLRNCVALGSSSISKYQCELLKRTNPVHVVLMTDKGLMEVVRERNCQMIQSVLGEVKIYYWNPSVDVPDKASPTDLGKNRFIQAVKKELVKWEVK